MKMYMQRVGGTMVFPYDKSQIDNGNCVELPYGYNPETGKVEKQEGSKPPVEVIHETPLADQIISEETFSTPIDEVKDDNSYENMSRSDLFQVCESLGIRYNQNSSRSTMLNAISKFKRDRAISDVPMVGGYKPTGDTI